MISYIKSECIRQIKSKRYIVSLLLMSLSIFILFQLFSSMSLRDGYAREESYLLNNDIGMIQAELYNLKMRKEKLKLEINTGYSLDGMMKESIKDFETFDLLENELKVIEEVVDEESEAFYAGDMETYMEKAIQTSYYVLLANKVFHQAAEQSEEPPYYNHVMSIVEKYNFPKPEFTYFQPGVNSFGILYGSVYRYQPDYGYFDTALHRIEYYDQLLSTGYTPVNMYQVDSATISYQTLRIIFPVAIPLLVIFLFFDSYDVDHSLGTTKTILTIPKGRRMYVYGNMIANLIVLLSILLIPLILFMITLGIKDGFHYMNYPLLADASPFNPGLGYTNIGPMNAVYKTNTEGLFPFSHFGLSQVSNFSISPIPTGSEQGSYWAQLRGVDVNKMILSPMLGWSSILTVLLYSIPLIIGFSLFCISLIFLINILLEKKMNVLISSIVVFLTLQFMAPFSSVSSLGWLNAMHFRNAIYSITGFTAYPLVLGLLSTAFSSFILIIASRIYIDKKNIT